MDVPSRAPSEKMCVMSELSTNVASASIRMRQMLSNRYNIEMGLPGDYTIHDCVCVQRKLKIRLCKGTDCR